MTSSVGEVSSVHPPSLWYAVGGSIIVLFFAVVIALAIYWSYEKSTPKPVGVLVGGSNTLTSTSSGSSSSRSPTLYHLRQDPYSDQSNYGSWPIVRTQTQPYGKDTCEQSDRRMWLSGYQECRCRYPYYGPDCSLEVHDDKYHAIGQLSTDHLVQMPSLGSGLPITASSKRDCSDQCDGTTGCHAFIYEESTEGNSCVLLSDPLDFPAHILTYHHQMRPNLYAKDSSMLLPHDRIYLAQGPAFFPPRFWLAPQVPGFAALHRYQVYPLDFHPVIAHMDQTYTGVYSRYPFAPDHAEHLRNHGATPHVYIHYPHEPLLIPQHWGKKLYVMYY